jgi:hypothetical protein
MTIWAGQWHSFNRLDGDVRHILYENNLPKLFRTRKLCREFIKEKYGYIAERQDLQKEPHGWCMPKAIKVNVVPNSKLKKN